MSDTDLKIIRERLQEFDELTAADRLQTLQEIQKIASVEPIPRDKSSSMCPVTKEPIVSPCQLKGCKYWVDRPWTKNCALSYLLGQEKKDKLSVEQVSMLYNKSPQRVESIYKRSFKIVQRHYLRDLLRARGIPQFTYMPGFCVTCQSRLMDDDLNDPALALGDGNGYCSADCKKQHPPQYYEIEKFFQSPFLRVVETGCELFNFFAVEEILGFQPNVLRNRLEKMREESTKKKSK